MIELSVACDDMGKVIGKQGRIAKAIRTVVNVAARLPARNMSSKSSNMIEIGRILKPHGIQGQLKVRLYSDNFEGFATRGFAYVPKGGSTWRMEYDVVRIDPPFIYLFADGVPRVTRRKS